jgi:hypothetical protein
LVRPELQNNQREKPEFWCNINSDLQRVTPGYYADGGPAGVRPKANGSRGADFGLDGATRGFRGAALGFEAALGFGTVPEVAMACSSVVVIVNSPLAVITAVTT